MGFELYIDLFIIQNLIYDYLILTGVAILTEEKMKISKLLIGLTISLLTSTLLFVLEAPLLLSFVPVLVIRIVFSKQGVKQFFKKVLYFYCLSLLLSGGIYSIAHFIKLNVTMLNYMFILFGISFVITVLYIMQNKYFEKEMVINQFKHDVTIIFGNRKIKGTGFVDTGNHLSDSKTAEPIIMIPSDFLTTGDVSTYLKEQKIESWYTEYSVINSSNQRILVFKPTVILIGEKIANKGMIGIVNNKFSDYDFLLQPSLVVGN